MSGKKMNWKPQNLVFDCIHSFSRDWLCCCALGALHSFAGHPWVLRCEDSWFPLAKRWGTCEVSYVSSGYCLEPKAYPVHPEEWYQSRQDTISVLKSGGDDFQASGVDDSGDDGAVCQRRNSCGSERRPWAEVLLQAVNAAPEISGYPCRWESLCLMTDVADGRKFVQKQYLGRGWRSTDRDNTWSQEEDVEWEEGLRLGPGKTTEKEEESDEKAKEYKESKRCPKMEPRGSKGRSSSVVAATGLRMYWVGFWFEMVAWADILSLIHSPTLWLKGIMNFTAKGSEVLAENNGDQFYATWILSQ